jgi:hypothetical protein
MGIADERSRRRLTLDRYAIGRARGRQAQRTRHSVRIARALLKFRRTLGTRAPRISTMPKLHTRQYRTTTGRAVALHRSAAIRRAA